MGRKQIANPSPATLAKRDARARMSSAEMDTERLRMRARLYGVTAADLAEQFRIQGGRCATCERVIGLHDRESDIDHEHGTGRVRGLICRRCNLALSAIDEDRGEGIDPMHRFVRLVRYAESGGVFQRLQLTLEEATA